MKKLEMDLDNEEFDTEVQNCDSDNCYHDCTTSTTNQCNTIFSLRY